MTKLLLIRHGKSEANNKRFLYICKSIETDCEVKVHPNWKNIYYKAIPVIRKVD